MTAPPTDPPVGVVAMLFTDIEGSTGLATRLGDGWAEVLADHHRIVGGAIAAEGGYVDLIEGDAFFAVFTDPAAAARAAVTAQRDLHRHSWPRTEEELKVRMGLHVGLVERAATGYVGLEIHRAARVAAAAHGGQLLLTAAAREVVGGAVATEFLGAHRLKDFPAPVHLYCASIDGRGAAAFPPPRTSDARPTNLPAGLPALVGRDDELAEVRAALLDESERLVTLAGRGGSGKTSLALTAGAGVLDEHPGGVWWVDLALVEHSDQVLGVIATTVGADREVQLDPYEAIVGRLGGAGATLVILDNLEHLLTAGRDVGRLSAALADLRLLVTTQVPLRLPAERVIVLDALDEDAALTLIERVARRRGARWNDAVSDRAALAEVARLLDGLPLALELAAARLALLSPVQLRDRLRTSLDLLKDPSRPARQQSLEATVEWTLDLLDAPACELFVRLGAFAAPVEIEEIESVAGGDGVDVLEALAGLLDVALLRRLESGDGRIRFGLPEALRQIAARRLDSTPDGDRWRRAHAQRQLGRLGVGLFCTAEEEDAALGALGEGHVALRWARVHAKDLAQPLAIWLSAWLGVFGRLREAAEILAPLVESLPDDPDLRAHVASRHSGHLAIMGEHDDAVRWAEQAVAWAQSECVQADALLGRGLARSFAGQVEAALADNREATRRARGLSAPLLCAALIFETQVLIATGAVAEATRVLEEAREVGERSSANALRALHTQTADLAMAAGRPDEALEPYARSLELADTRDDELQVLFDLRGMANALAALGRDEEAIEVLGLADEQAAEVGGDASIGLHLLGDEPVRSALGRLDGGRAVAAREQGRAVSAGLRVARACALGRAAVPV